MNSKVLITLLVIVLLGYAGYCTLAQYEYSQGLAALKAGDGLNALVNFERVRGYKFTVPSHSSEIQGLIDQSSLLVLGKSMRDKGQYKEALDAYESFIGLYPKSDTLPVVKDLLPAVYLDWGQSLQEKSDFEGALEKFDIISKKYPQTTVIKPATEAAINTHLKWGEELTKTKDFEAALEKYEEVLTKYPIRASEPAREAKAETYLAWGDTLVEEEKYETAVEKYEIILEEYPELAAAKTVQDNLDDVYLKWADKLRRTNQPELAFEKYRFIISKFDGSSSSSKAETELAPTKMEWAAALHQNQEFEKEVETLHGLIRDHSETPEAQQASQKIFPAYEAWGRQLITNKSFYKSMEIFTEAKQSAPDAETQTIMDAGIKEAVKGLAYDTGIDGRRVIDEARELACADQPVKSEIIGIQKGGKGKVESCFGYGLVPLELYPTMPAEFKYVIKADISISDIQTCSYTRPGDPTVYKLTRQRYVYKVTARNILTDKIVTSRSFFGPGPEYCPADRIFSSQSETILGGEVNEDEITNWLKQDFRYQ